MALKPGATIGILGGGQLGRMTAMAAARLGYNVHIFSDTPDSPAGQVSAHETVASYTDETALKNFAASVDVVTYEFENIPVETVAFLEKYRPVYPDSRVLAVAQDRIAEKKFLNDSGISTAPWRAVESKGDLEKALSEIGTPAVLKTARMGYDGKGQIKITSPADGAQIWAQLKTDAAILEGFVDFDCEVSVIVCRDQQGHTACYPPSRNVHKNHILHQSIVPAGVARKTADAALATAEKIAQAIGLIGVMGVEMFVCRDGSVLVNEIAPRPHNSGHWTMDACHCSQFEQLVRAVVHIPLGSTTPFADAVMTNLIGEDIDLVPEFLKNQNVIVHLYGKAETKPGRKMGHTTEVVNPDDKKH